MVTNFIKLSIALLITIFVLNISFGQKIKISSFDRSDLSNAWSLALRSSYDTLVVDKLERSWVVRPLRFKNIENKMIIFQKEVEVLAMKGAFAGESDALFRFTNCKNIRIIGGGAKLRMNKEEYKEGEWRHGISLKNSSNIEIENLLISDTGGDGIYIDGIASKLGSYSKDIRLRQIVCTNNKRQGMSIISAKNVSVEDCVFKNTIGTLPGAGVDLEPDNKFNRLEGISFRNCMFLNNDHAGIVLALHKLETESTPVSIEFYNCVFRNNHNETNRYIASEITFYAHEESPVKGYANFRNCLVEKSNWGLLYSQKSADAYDVVFEDCVVRDICRDNSFPVVYLEVPNYYTGKHTLGGISFKNLYVSHKSDMPFLLIRGSRAETLTDVSNITGTIIFDKESNMDVNTINYNIREGNEFPLKFIRSNF
ncbi:right-handed parallel beta-helix repeat-containing protein [Zobellia russellii]|uniref:right-handed parallel beta-helix repeat-containing protein n=1 Tax=Zobellia russellii TaxID=248907 RepID=UPI001BFF1629|nr:right-handed parallel beta-helix repeat-containing protein [Zobellia russellii]